MASLSLRRSWRLILFVAILIALPFVLARLDVSVILEAARRPSWLLLGVVYLAKNAIILGRGVRWRVLTGGDYMVGLRAMVWGYVVNLVAPFRAAGELARVATVTVEAGTSAWRTAGNVVAERALDFLSLCAVGFTLIIMGRSESTTMLDRLRGGLAGGLTLGIVLIAITAAAVIVMRTRKLHGRVQQIVTGLAALSNVRNASIATAISLLLWTAESILLFRLAQAFGIHLDLTVLGALVLALNLGLALPTTPGGVGIHQAIAIAVLTPRHANAEEAIAYSVVVQLLSMTTVILLWITTSPKGLRGRPGESVTQTPSAHGAEGEER